MVDFNSIKAYLGVINTNGDDKISAEELEKAQGKVPSLWLEMISTLAGGQDISVEGIMKGLGVEAETKPDGQEGTFHKESFFDYNTVEDCYGEEPVSVAKSLEDIPQGSHANIRDARNCDISKLELTKGQLLNLTIDKTTILSDAQREIIQEYTEKMKNPGLGVRRLHEQGITGKGVKIAIIDQPLGEHKEYSKNIIHHESVNCEEMGWNSASMHGAAVASIAVGQEVGVAPDADLVYFSAVNATKDKSEIEEYIPKLKAKIASPDCGDGEKEWFVDVLKDATEGRPIPSNTSYAKAIEKILDMNKDLPAGEKIPVISVSWGFDTSAPGYDKLQEVLQRAKDEGVFVVSTALEETHGFNTCGANRNPVADPDNPDSYEAGAFWKERNSDFFENSKDSLLLFPMDHRTTADFMDNNSYRYEGNDGGMSWSTPYIAGVYALAKQVNPEITMDEFWQKALETSDECHNNDDGKYVGRLINPEKLMEAIK